MSVPFDLDAKREDGVSLREDTQECVGDIYRPDVDTSGVNERRLIRKVDLALIPLLATFYMLNTLDRGAIGNARLYGMEAAIGISDKQYLLALTVYIFPYSFLEPPCNLAFRRLPHPSHWFAVNLSICGIAMMCHGFAKNYGDLLGLRILLGAAEAGVFPAIIFYLSCWYKRSQIGLRLAVFFASNSLAGAFSGLLAAAIHNMDGIAGIAGYAWIFIIEGIATIILAIISLFLLQGFPQSAKMLTEEERAYLIRGLLADHQFSASRSEPFQMKVVKQTLQDPKTYLVVIICAGFVGPLISFQLFSPTIVNQLGFDATTANLLSVPAYVWGCILTCVVGYIGDRRGQRGYANLVLFGTGFAGYIILIMSRSIGLSYFATFLAASLPDQPAWVSSNVEGSYKRAFTLGLAFGFGNLQGAVTSNVYRAQDEPRYILGHGIALAYLSIGFITSLAYVLLLRRENAARIRGERDEVIIGVDNERARDENGVFESVEQARREKGDAWSGFRYTL